MKKIVFLFLLVSFGLSAQTRKTDERVIEEEWRYVYGRKFNTWAIAVGYGAFWMMADVTDYNIIPNNIRFTPSAQLSWQLKPFFAVDLKYLYGNMYGKSTYPLFDDDTNPFLDNAGNQLFTDIQFKGDLHDISLNASFFINQMTSTQGPIRDRWNFFVKVGAGASLFRCRLSYVDASKNPRNPGYQFVQAMDLNVPGSDYLVNGYILTEPEIKTKRRAEVVVPATAGVMYRINNWFDISLEANMHLTASDHFDTILKGSSNDNYPYVGVYLHYIFGRKDRRHLRWTYRGYGFDILGRPKRDPLINEVDMFEKDIAKFVEGQEPKIRVVEISHTETSVEQPVFIRTIFFPKGGNIKFSSEDIILMAETVVQMMKTPVATLHLYSYVDGTDSGNHTELSDKQCEKIIDFLVNELAADRSKIETHSLGSSQSLVTSPDANPEIKNKVNRRIDMVLVL